MSCRRTTILPPPSCPDEDEIYLAELTPIENLAVFEPAPHDDMPTIPSPPPDHLLNL